MSEQNQGKSDIEKLVPGSKTINLNGHEIEVKPLENDKTLRAAAESDKPGKDNMDYFLELVAETLNENEGFSGVTAQEVKNSRGNILPLVTAVQQVNGLADFLDEEDLEEIK